MGRDAYRISRADLKLAAGAKVPTLNLAMRMTDRTWAPLLDSKVTEDGDTVVVTATTTHFTDLYLLRKWLVWLVCAGVWHIPLEAFPSYNDYWLAAVFGAFDGLVLRFTVHEEGGKPTTHDIPLDDDPVEVKAGITRFGKKFIDKVEIVDTETGEVLADITDQVRGSLLAEFFLVTSVPGFLLGDREDRLSLYPPGQP